MPRPHHRIVGRSSRGGQWLITVGRPNSDETSPPPGIAELLSREAETSFIRFSIQPAAIRGQSSILYVDPADAGRGRPRRYTVYVDEPIAL